MHRVRPHLLVLQMRIFLGFFALFARGKKVRVPPRVRVRSCPGRSARGLRRLMRRPVVRSSRWSSTTTSRARQSAGTDVLVCPPGSLLRASLSSGSGRLGATRVVDKGGMYKAGVAGLFHFVLCSFLLVPGPDAWRHGRSGPEGQLCSVLVLLVIILLVLCSLLLTTSPRCTTSWRVRIRSTVMSVFGWFADDSAPRAVFLPCRQAHGSLHYGRYGPEVQYVGPWMVCS